MIKRMVLMTTIALIHPLLLNASAPEVELWNEISKLLHLSAAQVQKIQNKVGALNQTQSDLLISAIKNMSAKVIVPSNPLPNDAMNTAANTHELLAENDYVRVLWASLAVGYYANPHTHQWPAIIYTLSEETIGITITNNGTEIKEPWSPILEESEGFCEPLAFYNCGPHDAYSLEIEFKNCISNIQ
jgi:hypothetical protein